MIFNETFNYLWSQMAGGMDLQATRRAKDYQRKRLKRAQLALALKAYFLEASWVNTAGTAGEVTVGSTKPVTQPLLVLDGAIRTTDIGAVPSTDNNNFEIQLERTGGDSRVQPSQAAIKDEHFLTPAQCAIRNLAVLRGQGAPWPLTWPVPLHLDKNELLQLTARVLTGGVPAGESTFVQFRALMLNALDQADDNLVASLRDWIGQHELQRPVYFSMVTEGARSIAFPATGAAQRTNAKTMEAIAPLLITGYSSLFARGKSSGNGSTANVKWRLQASSGHAFSKEEVDLDTYAFAGPGFFYQQFAHPFLLPQGSSLAASFSTLSNIADEAERIDNYVIFRGVTV